MRILITLLFAIGFIMGCGPGVEEYPPPTGKNENYGATSNVSFNSPNKPNIRFSKDAVNRSTDVDDDDDDDDDEEF